MGSVGGALVSPSGTCVEFFGCLVPPEAMFVFLELSKNPIYELEVPPVLIAIKLWGTRMRGSQVVWYLDNDAARSGFNYSRSLGSTICGFRVSAATEVRQGTFLMIPVD